MVRLFNAPSFLLTRSLLLSGFATALHAGDALDSGKETPTTIISRPNIVFILADDLGYTDIAPYGSEVNTPTLSDQGVRFTNY